MKHSLVKFKVNFSYFFQVIAILLIGVLFTSFVRTLLQVRMANESVSRAEKTLDLLTIEQEKFKQQLIGIQTMEYTEREARDKLGMAREGDIILVLPEEDVLKRLSPRVQRQQIEVVLPSPNWRKWFNLFL